jgi:hypothetical protein
MIQNGIAKFTTKLLVDKETDFMVKSGYLGPHCVVFTLYSASLSPTVVSKANAIPHNHDAPIMIQHVRLLTGSVSQ